MLHRHVVPEHDQGTVPRTPKFKVVPEEQETSPVDARQTEPVAELRAERRAERQLQTLEEGKDAAEAALRELEAALATQASGTAATYEGGWEDNQGASWSQRNESQSALDWLLGKLGRLGDGFECGASDSRTWGERLKAGWSQGMDGLRPSHCVGPRARSSRTVHKL